MTLQRTRGLLRKALQLATVEKNSILYRRGMLAREIWVLGIGKTLATAMSSSDMLACPAVDSVIERFEFHIYQMQISSSRS